MVFATPGLPAAMSRASCRHFYLSPLPRDAATSAAYAPVIYLFILILSPFLLRGIHEAQLRGELSRRHHRR